MCCRRQLTFCLLSLLFFTRNNAVMRATVGCSLPLARLLNAGRTAVGSSKWSLMKKMLTSRLMTSSATSRENCAWTQRGSRTRSHIRRAHTRLHTCTVHALVNLCFIINFHLLFTKSVQLHTVAILESPSLRVPWCPDIRRFDQRCPVMKVYPKFN